MELLSHNVGITCHQGNELKVYMSLAHIQVADVLTQSEHNALHSDGTTKFDHGYQVNATHAGVLTLGIQEVTSGSAQVALETLQEIMDELSKAKV